MSALLTDLLAAGLIERLDGDDSRFSKIEAAANSVAKVLQHEPAKLIRAILAGLDPDVPIEDPAIAQAQSALNAEWRSMSSVYPSPPVNLFRAVLLDACDQSAVDRNACILWLTAADQFPIMRLGREEAVIRRRLDTWALSTERLALVVPTIPDPEELAIPKLPEVPKNAEVTPRKVERNELLQKVLASAGPHNAQGQRGPSPNPHWPGGNQNWVSEFSTRMNTLLADELDSIYAELQGKFVELGRRVSAEQQQIRNTFTILTAQQQWMRTALQCGERRRDMETLRLNALWWSRARYSPSLRCGYRELDPVFSAVAMAIDLLREVSKPSPASVCFLLAETVAELPNAAFDHDRPLGELLNALQRARGRLPGDWLRDWEPAPKEGRISLRDLIWLVMHSSDVDVRHALARAGLKAEMTFSLPKLARALFRQEQAVQLASATK